MQVEGCKLTPILSPRVHQFTSQTGDRKKTLLLGIRTWSLGYTGEHAQLTAEPLSFRTVSVLREKPYFLPATCQANRKFSAAGHHVKQLHHLALCWAVIQKPFQHLVKQLDKNCLVLCRGVRQSIVSRSSTKTVWHHVDKFDRKHLAPCQAVRPKPLGTVSSS